MQGAVAAGGRGAVEAGLEILKAGGNAADSAAATIFALSVTDSRSFCFGGEVPILIYDAKHQTVTVIDGQGAAPRLATLDHFKRPGGIPAKGIEPAAVPAALDACLTSARPLRHDDIRPGDRSHQKAAAQPAAPRALARRPAPHARAARSRRGSGQQPASATQAHPTPTARAASAWSPMPSIADRSPVASTPGPAKKVP